MTASKIIGHKIRAIREEKGMTQEQFGYKIGADRQYVWSLEKGKKNITMSRLDEMARAFGVEVKEFFN